MLHGAAPGDHLGLPTAKSLFQALARPSCSRTLSDPGPAVTKGGPSHHWDMWDSLSPQGRCASPRDRRQRGLPVAVICGQRGIKPVTAVRGSGGMGVGERWMGSAGVPGGRLHKDQAPRKGCCQRSRQHGEDGHSPTNFQAQDCPLQIWDTHLALGFEVSRKQLEGNSQYPQGRSLQKAEGAARKPSTTSSQSPAWFPATHCPSAQVRALGWPQWGLSLL